MSWDAGTEMLSAGGWLPTAELSIPINNEAETGRFPWKEAWNVPFWDIFWGSAPPGLYELGSPRGSGGQWWV